MLAAHPDDEVLGCGGTVARMTSNGHKVYAAILGEGLTSRHEGAAGADPQALAALCNNSREAARILGCEDVVKFSLPDNRFDSVPLLDIVKIIEHIVQEVDPEIVFTHHGGDLNIDHRVVFQATLTATRPTAELGIRGVLMYEVPSSTEWAFQKIGAAFSPNIFVDIGETLDKKIAAMNCYESERRSFPHPRSEEVLRAIARRWGSVVGVSAGEAFELVRYII